MTADEAATRTRVGFALGASAVLASLNVVANFASQAVSDAGRRDVEALFSSLGVREAKRAAADYVHLHHMRAARSLALGAVLLVAFALATWREEIARSRSYCAGRALRDTGRFMDQDVNLRWIYVHMIEEYARHNGHADLIRELVDGAVGC